MSFNLQTTLGDLVGVLKKKVYTKHITTVNSVDTNTAPLTGFAMSGTMVCTYALSAAATEALEETVEALPLIIDINPNSADPVVPGSVLFQIGSAANPSTYLYYDRNGVIYRNMDPSTGAGIRAGTINYATGRVTLDEFTNGNSAAAVKVLSCITKQGSITVTEVHFRTAGAPIRPGSLYIQGALVDGTELNAQADMSGEILTDHINGSVDAETGIVHLAFGRFVVAAGHESEPWYDPSLLETDGTIWVPVAFSTESLMYGCAVYSYLPIDPDLVGIDPVRLPSDGRVPIVTEGDVIVIHNTDTDTLPSGLTAGQIIQLSRDNLSLVELYDADSDYVSANLYTVNLPLGRVTMADPLNLAGYTEPLVALHRREDRCLAVDVQITGAIAVAAGVTHDYPVEGSYVSSALRFGDLAAKVTNLFDQKTWTNIWSDTLIGDPCTWNFNDVNYPPVVTDKGAIRERWLLKFDTIDHFLFIGEKIGQIAAGYITVDFAPINPATGVPYLFIDYRAWGAGQAVGNCLRMNTSACAAPIQIVRTTLSGPVTEPNDQFTIQLRGDAN
jgi:hypothetical protein